MKNSSMRIINKINLNKNQIAYLASIFITNVGNGMYTIGISKIMYDKTESAVAFGGILILESVIDFIMQFIAGAIVDRSDCRRVSIISNYSRGIIFILSIIMYILTGNLYILIFSISVINIISSFYKSSNFKLLALVANKSENYLKLNSDYNLALQVGQMLGVMLIIPIAFLLNNEALLFLDGITLILAAFLTSFVRSKEVIEQVGQGIEKIKVATIVSDWIGTLKKLYSDMKISKLIVFSMVDVFAVSLVNVMLVPVVSEIFTTKGYMVSILDSSFALGAIASVIVIKLLYKRVGFEKSKYMWILFQGILFCVFSFLSNEIFSILILFSIGIANATSIVSYQTLLQSNIPSEFKGKLASARLFLNSLISILLIPVITNVFDISVKLGLISSGVILILMGIIIRTITKKDNLS